MAQENLERILADLTGKIYEIDEKVEYLIKKLGDLFYRV